MDTLVIRLHPYPDNPSAWTLFSDETGLPLAAGNLLLGAKLSNTASAARIWVIVPGTDVTTHTVALPPHTSYRARAAISFLLEDELAEDSDGLHLALAPAVGGEHLVAAVSGGVMKQWQDKVSGFGFKPDLMIPDYLALPAAGDAPVIRRCGGLLIARTHTGGFSIEAEVADWVLDDDGMARAKAVEEDDLIHEMFAALNNSAVMNLLQGNYALRRDWSGLRRNWGRSAVLAASLAIFFLFAQLADGFRMHRQAEAAQDRVEALMREVLPDAKRVVNPRAQIRARVQDLRATDSGAFLRMSGMLFSAVDGVPGVTIETLRFNAKQGELAVGLALPSYEAAQALRTEMQRQGGVVQEGAARQEGSRFLTDITVRLP